MKSLILLLLSSFLSAQAGIVQPSCTPQGICGKPPDKNKAPAEAAQKTNGPASNPNNNKTNTNGTTPSQAVTKNSGPAPTLPTVNPPPRGFTPSKQNQVAKTN